MTSMQWYHFPISVFVLIFLFSYILAFLISSDVWFHKMKVCSEYYEAYEPPPPDARNDFMKNVVLPKLEHKDVKLSCEVRLKKTKDKNKDQLLLELYDDLQFESKQLGPRTQKKIRALEKYDLVIDAQGLIKSAIVTRIISAKKYIGFGKHV